ncbi:MAG TPA: zinc ABC transporter substrate-binding protein [Spirochaetia bacterium]|nr:zinc ABC transporter substrate-binding protein [Spirochaetia bacterium]
MKLRQPLIVLLFALFACPVLFAGGQGEGQGSAAANAPSGTAPAVRAFVSIPPQIYFVKEIGGSRVEVQSMVPAGVEPETYDPTPRQIALLSQSRLYFAVGLPFETVLIPKIRSSMKGVTIVDTQAGVPLRSFAQHTVNSSAEVGTDPHIWLSPELVKIQGAAIEAALVEADPAGAADYESGLAKLDAQMDSLHKEIAASLAGLQGRSFLVFHPAFGYFADEFGLKQVSIEVEGKSPGPRQLADLIALARKLGVKMIFVEPQFDQSRAQVVADSIKARVVTIDPLAEDYVSNLTEVAKQIRAALQ